MSVGDFFLLGTILIALYYVPRYLWRVYGGAEYVKHLRERWAGSRSVGHGASASSATVALAQQHQSAPELVPVFDDLLDYLRRHNLTDEQAIDLLTLARRESGDLLSANKIRDIVGGNEAVVKARVAAHRPKPPQPKPSARLERPANGWGTR